MNFQSRFLSAAEQARLDSWAVEIAEEARGLAQDAGNGDWRIGDSRALIIHPGALFYDFTLSKGGRGALALIAFLHNVDAAAALKLARAWLAAHQGEGRLAHDIADDEDAARSTDDAQRIAEIETMWKHRQPPGGTPVETYLASRKLTSCDALGWLPNLRGGEGAMIAAVTDPAGKLVAAQLTYLQADGSKSPVKPQRETWRGPHDWASRGVVWLSPYDGSGEITVCEGVEDGLSLVGAGAANVAAILGVGRLGKVRWPWGARKLVIARDDDPPGSPADNALYRGVIRQRGEGLMAYILLRPRMIAPDVTAAIKDANDLHRYDPTKVWEWLSGPAIGPEDLGPEARNAALDEVSRLSDEQHERARKATAPMLGFGRVNALDKARISRIAERQAAQKDDEEEEEVWPDPVTDLAEVLDAAAIEVGRYIKASPAAIDTVVLWGAGAHVQQRADLHINIAPRTYVTSPVPGCGKTLLLEIIAAFTPRSMMLSSTSVSGLFREIDARKPTLCLDEFDKQMAGASQEHMAILDSGHRKTSAYVLRSAKTEDGQFIREKFSTFTAMAFSGIKKLPDAMTSRCIIVALQRAGADDRLEHLVDGSSEKLTEIRRKLARWAKDVTALPIVDRPKALANRVGDNWYTIRRIAKLAGETWYQRAMDAAMTPAMTADTNVTLALLDAIWRAFDETKRSRMHTAELLSELLDMDEGRWREARHGQPITAYYLRDNLGDMLPSNAEEIAPRRWREGSAHQQYGYDVLHLKDAFQRYLGKGPPGQTVKEEGAESDQDAAPKHTARKKTKEHPSHPSQTHETSVKSSVYAETDVSRMPETDQAQKPRKRRSARKEPAVADPPQASASVSASEKHEEMQATPADETDEADEADNLEGSRAHPVKRCIGQKGPLGGSCERDHAMLDSPALRDASTLINGIAVNYCVDAARGRRLLERMATLGQIALDIETAPNKAEVDRLAELTQARAATVGKLKALRKLKGSADEIADLVAERDGLGARIKLAEKAGLDPRRSRIRLVQAYDGGREVLVIDIDRTGVAVLAALEGADVVCHNAGFEMSFLEPAGVALGEVHCTLQAARLTLGERLTSLADVAAAYLNVTLDKSQQVSDWGALHLTREQLTYAALDAIVEWEVAQHVFVALRDQTPAYEIQVRAVPAAMRMQERGFKFDVDAHARLIAELKQERLAVEQEYRAACLSDGCLALADKVPSTPAQKGDLLTALLTSEELRRWARTAKSGALSTRRSELNRARHYPPILALAKLSRIDKMLSSFGQTLAVLTAPETGRIHASYSVASTASGRASCSRPNLQQIPQDQRFRALFIAEPGNVLICADYTSMELRAAAHIFGDSAMTSAFEDGLNLHRITAARMTGKALADVTPEERKGAKAVNFGAIYGQGPRGLMQAAWEKFELVLTQPEAEEWTRSFKDSYSGLVRGQQEHHRRCQTSSRIVIGKDAARGIGRIFPFSRLKEGDNGYTRSRNLPIQGACADASMLALTYVDDRLFDAEIDGGPVAWLHDEIVVEVAIENADRAAAILEQAMIDGFAETFPGAPLKGLVELRIGMNWSEAKGQ